jgi:urea transport system permease protein
LVLESAITPPPWIVTTSIDSCPFLSVLVEVIRMESAIPKPHRRSPKLTQEDWVAIGLLVIAILIPLVLSDFRLNLIGRFLALAIVALGIDLIWGYTGLLSLGHGVFFTLGGYALAMHLKLAQIPADATVKLPEFMSLYGVTELPWFWQPFKSFPVALVGLIAIPAITGGLLGYLVFRNRIRGVYFSILTQAATIVFFNFFNGQQKLINGTNGLRGCLKSLNDHARRLSISRIEAR